MKKVGALLRSFGTVILISLVLFLVINVVAYWYLAKGDGGKGQQSLYVHKKSDEGVRLRKEVFGTEDVNLLRKYATPPGFSPHTVLHFSEGKARPHYSMGVEGVRYLADWTDEKVRGILKASGRQCSCLGDLPHLGMGFLMKVLLSRF